LICPVHVFDSRANLAAAQQVSRFGVEVYDVVPGKNPHSPEHSVWNYKFERIVPLSLFVDATASLDTKAGTVAKPVFQAQMSALSRVPNELLSAARSYIMSKIVDPLPHDAPVAYVELHLGKEASVAEMFARAENRHSIAMPWSREPVQQDTTCVLYVNGTEAWKDVVSVRGVASQRLCRVPMQADAYNYVDIGYDGIRPQHVCPQRSGMEIMPRPAGDCAVICVRPSMSPLQSTWSPRASLELVRLPS
jgi:hypothetical protein